jgi:gliding motility-associated lipoprotein GldH
LRVKLFMKKCKGTVLLLSIVGLLASCKEVTLYERQVNVPGGAWETGKQLGFSIEIPDTTVSYYLMTSIRHTSTYPYRNIWLRLGLQQPGSDSTIYQDFDVPLASNDAWLGAGMNDVYDRRIRLFSRPVKFNRSGKAVFTLEHIMRDNPLPGVLQAGIRIEPAP